MCEGSGVVQRDIVTPQGDQSFGDMAQEVKQVAQ